MRCIKSDVHHYFVFVFTNFKTIEIEDNVNNRIVKLPVAFVNQSFID